MASSVSVTIIEQELFRASLPILDCLAPEPLCQYLRASPYPYRLLSTKAGPNHSIKKQREITTKGR
ncbi:hypothetical protein GFGA_1c1302 [Gluconobacter frateurii NBRC 103465]|nr:hypothetical protein GFGA_1c1302 [Gluconobacter frateurii NBRC 103465]